MRMIDIKKEIQAGLSRACEKVGVHVSEATIPLDFSKELAFGDYSSSVALAFSKQMATNPLSLAQSIREHIDPSEFYTTSTSSPGFINFHLKPTFFAQMLSQIVEQSSSWGHTASRKDTVLLEHSSPNLFKPFHIGHLVNNAIGESLGRLLAAQGSHVISISYPSDISPGIAKAVWALRSLVTNTDELTVDHFGKAYAAGVKAYEENPEAKVEIDRITKDLYTKNNTSDFKLYEYGKAQSENYFKSQVKRLGSDFKAFIYESESEVEGKKIVIENTPRVFEISEGAYIYRGSKEGLFDNVFINSAGFATYLGKDIGLLSIKFDRYIFDTSITVTDIEQKPHFQLLKAAAHHIRPEWTEKSQFVHHGRLQFVGGKISSRYGNVPLLEDLFEIVRDKVHEKVAERLEKESDSYHKTLEMIAVAALKFSILRAAPGTNIVYDFERATSVEGDSGPYVQYTHARCVSLLQKAKEQGYASHAQALEPTELERLLCRFPDVVARAAAELQPHHIAHYILSIASAFNAWYATVPVLQGEHIDHKLAIVRATQVTIQNALTLLGIGAPEKM